jgi:YVTN family beta-propeller protein
MSCSASEGTAESGHLMPSRSPIFDLATVTLATPIKVGTMPTAIAITADGTTGYVTNSGDGTITPIDLPTATANTPIKVGRCPKAIAITA